MGVVSCCKPCYCECLYFMQISHKHTNKGDKINTVDTSLCVGGRGSGGISVSLAV